MNIINLKKSNIPIVQPKREVFIDGTEHRS